MAGEAALPPGAGPREQVRFYLLDHETVVGKAIDIALLALNLVFVGLFVAETYSVSAATATVLARLDVVIALVFLVEYLLRLYGAENRLAEATDPYTVVDLLAILPALLVFVLPAGVVVDLAFLRALRVVRVLRFYRFTRDAKFFFGTISEEALRGTKLLTMVFVLLFVSAGLFYSAEVDANPAVNNFGDAFYYTVVTLTTVGFGDVTPVTRAGRWVTVAAILAAVILVPRQASRILKEWTTDKIDVTCPQCGLQYHDPDASHCKSCGHVIYHEYDSRERE
ncbi:ion transporter [Salinirubellus salinus]|jgi:voltage-gated potassium channel|uniref:Ion transporter n=1 Tax=Salinirubellus salinus TaxID=1364945 RepID=A0A9E7R3J1_9EURY|nr:ion transporter [Salinirubellus salinus]UWM54972.1 ion transporter [Salinirubellus salinus]